MAYWKNKIVLGTKSVILRFNKFSDHFYQQISGNEKWPKTCDNVIYLLIKVYDVFLFNVHCTLTCQLPIIICKYYYNNYIIYERDFTLLNIQFMEDTDN